MKNAITIRLDPDLEKLLDRLSKQTGRTRSDLIRDALRRQLRLLRFERLRRQALPFAEARGYLTDEDVTRDVYGAIPPSLQSKAEGLTRAGEEGYGEGRLAVEPLKDEGGEESGERHAGAEPERHELREAHAPPGRPGHRHPRSISG